MSDYDATADLEAKARKAKVKMYDASVGTLRAWRIAQEQGWGWLQAVDLDAFNERINTMAVALAGGQPAPVFSAH